MTRPASWERAPERRFTALWEKPPAGGRDWVRPPASEATPTASSSWSVLIGGSLRCRLVRATSTVSRNAITAIASAPGSRAKTSSSTGSDSAGQSGRHGGDEGETVLLDVGEGHQDDAGRDGQERARDLRREPAQQQEPGDRATETTTVTRLGVRQLRDHVGQLGEEAVRVRVRAHAEQVRQLADRHRQPDPDPDAREGGRADVLHQRAEAERPHGEQAHARPARSA